MKIIKLSIALLLVTAIFISCGRDDKDTNDSADLTDISGKIESDGTMPTLSDDEKEVIEYQKAKKQEKSEENTAANTGSAPDYKVKKGNFDGFLVGNWTYDIKVDVNEDGVDESLKGNVLQLHGDQTFNIWSKGKLEQEGNFTYDRNNTTLRLIPTTGQASEWTVQYLNGTAIFVGTATFGNNMTQIRMKEGVITE